MASAGIFLTPNLVSPSKKSFPSIINLVTFFPSTSISPSALTSTPGNFFSTSSSFRSVPDLKESAL